MDEPSALTLRMRSFSITTTAFVIAFPAPPMSLPKRSALIGAADLGAGQTTERMAKDERMIIEILTLRIECIPLLNERFPSMTRYAIEKRRSAGGAASRFRKVGGHFVLTPASMNTNFVVIRATFGNKSFSAISGSARFVEPIAIRS